MPGRARDARLLVLVAAWLLGGCASGPADSPRHVLPDMPVTRDGSRVSLSTDAPDAAVAPALDRLEKLELLLDRAFPWLAPPRDRVLVLLIDDEGRFRAVARGHGVPSGGASEFSCRSGEVVLRWKPEEFGQGPAEVEGWVQSPRVAPLAEVLFRRRLEATYGPELSRTALEDGCARLFGEAAAHELGEVREAERRMRDDLVDAFLPLFLGGEPVLARTLLARGSSAGPHASARSHKPVEQRATAYAVARWLVVSGEGERGARDFDLAFAAAAGRPGASDALEARGRDLAAHEGEFERWLRGKTTAALLDALGGEPVAAARWEARAALKLVAAVDVEVADQALPKERAAVVERARAEVEARTTVRFADEFDGPLREERDRRRPGGLERIVASARRTLEERGRGYGHPSLEEMKGQLGRSLEARQRSLSAP